MGVRERDNRWISLTRDEFGIPDRELRDNIAHGDSALLSLLIYKTREAFRSGSWTPFILATLTQFDMSNTLREAWRGGIDCTAVKILREIRHGYLGLHQGTNAFSAHAKFYNPVLAWPSSYRFCTMTHPQSSPRFASNSPGSCWSLPRHSSSDQIHFRLRFYVNDPACRCSPYLASLYFLGDQRLALQHRYLDHLTQRRGTHSCTAS